MTYNVILDGYFSSYWSSMGIPLLLLILWHVFRRKLRKGKDQTLREVVVVYGIVFVLWMTAGLVNPIYWGYGSPEAVREIRYTGDKLLVIDHIRTMGSEGEEGTPCSRVHVIDPDNGEKSVRFTLGEEADLLGVNGDTLIVTQYNDATAYSLATGAKLIFYSRETLPELFPELKAGVNNLSWGYENSRMEITSNDGALYELDLLTGLLYEATVENQEREMQVTGKLYCEEESIKLDDVENSYLGPEKFSLDGIDGNQYALYLHDENDSILNSTLSFLDGEFVAVDNQDSTCIILSFETLEHHHFILTCLSLDGKKKWEIRQSQFNGEFQFTDYWLPHSAYNEDSNQFTFWIDTSVYCIDAASGKMLWETAL